MTILELDNPWSQLTFIKSEQCEHSLKMSSFGRKHFIQIDIRHNNESIPLKHTQPDFDFMALQTEERDFFYDPFAVLTSILMMKEGLCD